MANKYQIIITPRAEVSLEKTLHYLIENVSFETAQHVRQKLLNTIYSLSKMPTANPKYKVLLAKIISFIDVCYLCPIALFSPLKKVNNRFWL